MPDLLIKSATALIITCGSFLCADEPSADYIFPAGGQRGTTVEFRVGGHFLHDECPFEMQGSGIDCSGRVTQTQTTWFEGPMIFKPASQKGENYPKDYSGSVRIAADAMPGSRYWQLWTSQGAVSSKPFIIGDLPEFVEHEIDGSPLPEQVHLPVTINGRIFPREDVDVWEFKAEAGQSVTCEVLAARMGSPLNSRLEVRDPDGRIIAENYDHFGNDSFLRFPVAKTGIHQLKIHDSTLQGLQHFVYRLTITAGPYVDRVFPLGGRAEERVVFELTGQNLPNSRVVMQLPAARARSQLQYFPVGERLSNPILIDVSDLPEIVEGDQSTSAEEPVTLPVVLNGRIMAPGEVDGWIVAGRKGETFRFSVLASTFGSPLDPSLTILDANDKSLKKIAGKPDKPIEPSTEFTFPADGTYTVQVEDCFGNRGGPDFAYRLKIEPPPSPDFRLKLPSDAVTVARGTETKFKVAVERLNGFKGEVTLVATDLPDGVTVAATKIAANKKDAEIVFVATESAKISPHRIRVTGTAEIGEQSVTRTAIFPGSTGTDDRTDVLLAVAMPTPFKLSGVDFQTSYAARGSIHRRRYVIDWGGYEGSLTLSLADRQIRHLQGVKAKPMIVKNGVQEIYFPIQLPTWLEMNRTGRTVVMAVGEVLDEDGNTHKVSFSSGEVNDQIIILTAPCPMNVAVEPQSVLAIPDSTTEVSINVSRGILQNQPVTISLIRPAHFRGVSATETVIPADQTSGTLNIRLGQKPGPFNMPAVIRAETMIDGDPVVAETPIEFASPLLNSVEQKTAAR